MYQPPVLINREACTACGICGKVCMFSIIISNESGSPGLNPHAPPCSRCGHCIVFCPSSAIQLSGFGERQIVPVLSEKPVTPDQIKTLVTSRRSTRQYLKKVIPREVFENLFDIVRYAPSAMNLQTVHWQVIYDTSIVGSVGSAIISWMNRMIEEQRLHEFVIGSSFPYITREWEKGRDLITHGAPHLLMTYSGASDPTAPTDAIIATSYLELTSMAYGLGTCWAGIIKRAAEWSPEVRSVMDLPEGTIPQTVLLIGYPALRHYAIPSREPARIRWNG